MKSLMKKIDQFCYRHPRFGIPNLMLYVVVGNAIVWLFTLFTQFSGSGVSILSYLYFSPYHILRGEIWRLLTFIIIPNSTSILALIFFYFYYMIGRTVEAQWGPGKFTIYFFSGVLLTIIYGFVCYFVFHVNFPVEFVRMTESAPMARITLPPMTAPSIYLLPSRVIRQGYGVVMMPHTGRA